MNHRQSGFTMIELIVVIVILGILAATALPRFIDLRSDAQQAALDGIAGSLASAASLNYAGCAANNNTALAGKCVTVNSCNGVGGLLQTAVPSGYTLGTATGQTTNGTVFSCTVVYTDGKVSLTGTYSGIAAGNP